MKKIKKRTRTSSRQWSVFVVDPPKSVDPQELTTLLVLIDPRNEELGDFRPLPRPVEIAEVVEAIEEAYRFQPLNRRPGRIKVTDKRYAEAFEASPILEEVDIVVEPNREFEKEIREVLMQMGEPLSQGPALGIGPRKEEFLAISRRLYATNAWLRLFDQEYFVLDVEGAPLARPVVSVMGLMGQIRGFGFFTSREVFEAFAEEAATYGEAAMENLDQLLLRFDGLWEFEEGLQRSFERQGLTFEGKDVPYVAMIQPGREEYWLEDDEVDEALRHFEALAVVLEDLARREFPPYPQMGGVVEKDAWRIQVGISDEAVQDYVEDREILEDHGLVSAEAKILRIRVELEGITPPIYRVIEVPDYLSMAGLHDVIQRAMGWQNLHPWSFHYKGKDYTLVDEEGEPMGAFEEEDARYVTIKEAIGARAKNFTYAYNFEDEWQHSLRVEERKAPEKGASYPRLVEGARACPPEAVGGVEGYAEAMLALEEPESADEELLEWIEGFNPEGFDANQVEFPSAEMFNRIWLHEEPVEFIEFEDEPFDPEEYDAMRALVFDLQTALPPEALVEATDEDLRKLAEEMSPRHPAFEGPENIYEILRQSRVIMGTINR
jgi:hypothetical protein